MNEIDNLLNNLKVGDLLLYLLFGTCCMGSSEANGVVDENFKVFNYDNLFVTDSSIFPFPTRYNPQLTIMIYETSI